MKINIKIFGLLSGVMLLFSCKQEMQGPLVDNGSIPEQVKVQKVENLPGGAKIYYSIPNDPNLLYVKAIYKLNNGEEKIAKSSTYTNFVQLNGFADMDETEVQLVTVSRSEKESSPVVVKIKPLLAKVHEVFKTLKAQATFGGVSLEFHNKEGLEYVLHSLVKNSAGKWTQLDRLYSKSIDRIYAVRGMESKPTEMAFYFSDQWNNSSDTLLADILPLFEVQLDKALWKQVNLFNDTNIPYYDSWALSNLWDGTGDKIFYGHTNLPEGVSLPNWFTIDVGKKSVFSRIRVNQLAYHNSWMFAGGAPRLFEIYGSNDPKQDGSWDSWTLLGEYESKKPSGSPIGYLTNEDIAVAKAGEDFDFPVGIDGYRYFRFKTNKTWGGDINVMLAELTLWGQPVN